MAFQCTIVHYLIQLNACRRIMNRSVVDSHLAGRAQKWALLCSSANSAPTEAGPRFWCPACRWLAAADSSFRALRLLHTHTDASALHQWFGRTQLICFPLKSMILALGHSERSLLSTKLLINPPPWPAKKLFWLTAKVCAMPPQSWLSLHQPAGKADLQISPLKASRA